MKRLFGNISSAILLIVPFVYSVAVVLHDLWTQGSDIGILLAEATFVLAALFAVHTHFTSKVGVDVSELEHRIHIEVTPADARMIVTPGRRFKPLHFVGNVFLLIFFSILLFGSLVSMEESSTLVRKSAWAIMSFVTGFCVAGTLGNFAYGRVTTRNLDTMPADSRREIEVAEAKRLQELPPPKILLPGARLPMPEELMASASSAPTISGFGLPGYDA